MRLAGAAVVVAALAAALAVPLAVFAGRVSTSGARRAFWEPLNMLVAHLR